MSPPPPPPPQVFESPYEVDIDEGRVIDVRFMDSLHIPTRIEMKTGTARRAAFGEIGTIFRVAHRNKGTCPRECMDARYMVIGVLNLPLQDVKAMFWDLEGCESPAEFVDTWNRIPGYPEYDVAKNTSVVFHRFRRIQ